MLAFDAGFSIGLQDKMLTTKLVVFKVVTLCVISTANVFPSQLIMTSRCCVKWRLRVALGEKTCFID